MLNNVPSRSVAVLHHSRGPCRGPRRLTRREMVQVGGAAALGLSLPGLLRADEGRGPLLKPTADACILIFLDGGPSHLDMGDMKPSAPAEIRGEFRPIATSLPGVQLCEHLPRLAQRVHLGTIIRLARRLVEAGVRVASISWAPDANATWDTHGNNFQSLKNVLLPQLDMAVSALLDDLRARRMLDRTLVAVMGEFGRSPRVNGGAGRDHWNFGYGLFLAGGGVRAGHVHGATDRIGALAQTDPVTPAEIVATIYRCLGIPADLELHDQLGRPLTVVPHGTPIQGVLA